MNERSKELDEALQKLAVFSGSWSGTGEFLEGAGPGEGSHLKTTDAYKWMPGGFFLIYEGALDFGAGKLEAHRVIGYDEKNDAYTMHAFDSLGFAREYKGSVDGHVWHFKGERERVTFTFKEEGKKLDTFWENSENGKEWVPLCKAEAGKK